jgi:hypothetical protein
MSFYRILYFIYFKRFNQPSFDKLYARVMIRFSNIILPIYFKLSNWLPTYKISKTHQVETGCIVSLTTFPARIDKVWLTIESILRQNIKPSKVVLWLFKGEFEHAGVLPKNLIALQRRGLEIRFCDENLMPHKKYHYTFNENRNSTIITIDDDMFYPPSLISTLLKHHAQHPHAICCAITREIKTVDGQICPYNEWKYVRNNTEPRFSNLVMGGGGTLFPSNSVHPAVFDKEIMIKYALKADDLWLKIMSVKNGVKVASCAGEFPRFFVPILSDGNKLRLTDANIGEGQNNRVFKDLINYYKIDVNVFCN